MDPRELEAMQYFMRQGYDQNQAAAIVGQLKAESGLNPAAIGDQGTARGIAQWRGPRQQGMPADYQGQLARVQQELQGREAAVRERLMQARNARDATAAFNAYERPQGYRPGGPPEAVHRWPERLANAQRLANMQIPNSPRLPIPQQQPPGMAMMGSGRVPPGLANRPMNMPPGQYSKAMAATEPPAALPAPAPTNTAPAFAAAGTRPQAPATNALGSNAGVGGNALANAAPMAPVRLNPEQFANSAQPQLDINQVRPAQLGPRLPANVRRRNMLAADF